MRTISLYDSLQEIAQYEIDHWPDGHIVTLGRSESMMWSFPEFVELSNHHLSIRKLGDELYIRDEGSSNGTTIEDAPMTHPVRMRTDVTYLAAGRLSVYLEGAAATEPCEDIDCSSVFPEELGFGLSYTAPTPAPVVEEPIISLAPEPVEEEPIISLVPEPVVEEPIAQAPAPTSAPAAKVKAAVALGQDCIRPFLPITGTPKTGIPRDFEIQVNIYDECHDIPIGGKLILQVFSPEPCHLLIFCREQDGTSSMLYPNKQQISQTIPAGVWTMIPDADNPHFEFVIEGPAGVDEIQVIARAVSGSFIKKTAPKKGSADPKQKKPSRWSHASLQINVYE